MTYKKFMSLFLIAGSIASTLCSCAATDSSAVVGYIDEHPITMEEFNYFLSQQKSSVCQSYSQLYGITSFDSAFWNNEYGDSTPLDSARASAKETCLEAYATQMLAEKTTSAEFLSFSQLKENAENFNTARKESTSNGGIVYGPIEYSFDSYYHRYLSQLENDIKEYWISTNAVSDADIDAFYSENQNLFSLNGDADVSAIYLSYIPSDGNTGRPCRGRCRSCGAVSQGSTGRCHCSLTAAGSGSDYATRRDFRYADTAQHSGQ